MPGVGWPRDVNHKLAGAVVLVHGLVLLPSDFLPLVSVVFFTSAIRDGIRSR